MWQLSNVGGPRERERWGGPLESFVELLLSPPAFSVTYGGSVSECFASPNITHDARTRRFWAYFDFLRQTLSRF